MKFPSVIINLLEKPQYSVNTELKLASAPPFKLQIFQLAFQNYFDVYAFLYYTHHMNLL